MRTKNFRNKLMTFFLVLASEPNGILLKINKPQKDAGECW